MELRKTRTVDVRCLGNPYKQPSMTRSSLSVCLSVVCLSVVCLPVVCLSVVCLPVVCLSVVCFLAVCLSAGACGCLLICGKAVENRIKLLLRSVTFNAFYKLKYILNMRKYGPYVSTNLFACSLRYLATNQLVF